MSCSSVVYSGEIEMITVEIARLERSMKRLAESNELLAQTDGSDPEFALAIKENVEVLASQERKIVDYRQQIVKLLSAGLGQDVVLPRRTANPVPVEVANQPTDAELRGDREGVYL
ncbi:hypothetical protein HKX48_002508 [Thoreauomyces humboldtii]|nr:hypothetical protein HKX48_002508 [Thoreauomyces humboldtii]